MNEHSNLEVSKAIKLALNVMVGSENNPDEYKIIKVENLLAKGPSVWLVTFKIKRIIPKKKGGIIGAGGEIFITVDLDTNSAKISGYGE